MANALVMSYPEVVENLGTRRIAAVVPHKVNPRVGTLPFGTMRSPENQDDVDLPKQYGSENPVKIR